MDDLAGCVDSYRRRLAGAGTRVGDLAAISSITRPERITRDSAGRRLCVF